MTKKTFNSVIILFILVILNGLMGCNPSDECRKEKNVVLTIAFKQKVLNQTTGNYSISNLTIDSIWVRSIDRDSLIYNKKRNLQSINLPLRKFSQPSVFQIRFNNVTDTIHIFHQTNENYFLSLECGCIAVHTINEVISTNHYIDSVSVINKDVNTTNTTHIQIFN